MAAIEAQNAFESALNGGKVRRKANRTPHLRARVARVAKRVPEVMVKITGFGKGGQHVKAHLTYISRNGKVELETNNGQILEGKAQVNGLFQQWAEDFSDAPRHKNQRDTMHMVLSMPEGTPQEAVRQGARSFAQKMFGKNHEYVFALHTDDLHPHVHVTVKMRGFDGKRLNPGRADLQAWREAFAQNMRDQGVEADATPRSVRGVVRKPERSVVRHIERGGEQRAPRMSRVQAARVKEAADELSAEAKGLPVATRPWDVRIQAAQHAARGAWLSAAAVLDQSRFPYPERPNEQPRYDSLDISRVRAGQRAAAVYQSDLERSGRKAPAAALTRMRDVSRLDVVQHQRAAQVLLLTNAPDRVGGGGIADPDLRRPRTRPLGPAGDRQAVNGVEASASVEDGLAGRIRGFVDAMPAIDTQRRALKQQLTVRFTQELDSDRAQGLAPDVQPNQTSGSSTEPRS